jgi:hypothetical protein
MWHPQRRFWDPMQSAPMNVWLNRYFSFQVLINRASRNVWSAAELQAKNVQWQLVCANVFGLQWSP